MSVLNRAANRINDAYQRVFGETLIDSLSSRVRASGADAPAAWNRNPATRVQMTMLAASHITGLSAGFVIASYAFTGNLVVVRGGRPGHSDDVASLWGHRVASVLCDQMTPEYAELAAELFESMMEDRETAMLEWRLQRSLLWARPSSEKRLVEAIARTHATAPDIVARDFMKKVRSLSKKDTELLDPNNGCAAVAQDRIEQEERKAFELHQGIQLAERAKAEAQIAERAKSEAQLAGELELVQEIAASDYGSW